MSDERVLIITGAGSGIGKATAKRLAGTRRLVLSGRRPEPLEELAAELGGPERAIAVPGDVAEWAANQRLAESALNGFGRIDEVFANAGFGATRGFLEESPEHWRSMILTNVLGPALTIRATLPHLLERGTGHYVVTSSVAGREVMPGSMYSASKHAATAIGEALRRELRHRDDGNGIKVTLIEPGVVDTPFFENRPEAGLKDDDIARSVAFALDQPEGVDLNEILIRPIGQAV
ncbi:MAG: SDR family oxidoreductase [Solirubrobacterales bacterium]|nr:SDR family oxidoreductase [Solirubrobacterales bacterium]